jgi:hypothetical protein
MLDLVISLSLNTSAPEELVLIKSKEQEIAEQIFEESYKEKRSILRTRKVIVHIEDRTDFVLRFRNRDALTVVYYFDI